METPESYRQKVIDDVINEERLRIAAIFSPIKKWREFKALENRVQELKRKGLLEMLIVNENDAALKEQLVQLKAVIDSKIEELTSLKNLAIEYEKHTFSEADLQQFRHGIAENEIKLREAYANDREGDVEIYANNILSNERMIKENNDYKNILVGVHAKSEALDSQIKQAHRDALYMAGVGKERMEGITKIREKLASSPSISKFLNTLKERETKFKEELKKAEGTLKKPRLKDELGTDARLAMDQKIDEVRKKE